jgi:hypothetical protein
MFSYQDKKNIWNLGWKHLSLCKQGVAIPPPYYSPLNGGGSGIPLNRRGDYMKKFFSEFSPTIEITLFALKIFLDFFAIFEKTF